ncbi:hypothetical protein [Caballeronia sp. GAWG1-1]|uniref:hypothetical protein n=1 Tax=Caballeronia sp. GAWG1-1 TaxID=2921742 RepID=UPI002028E498|nr:hypothetical protein [Caballeronia sp. GAWG1-1]
MPTPHRVARVDREIEKRIPDMGTVDSRIPEFGIVVNHELVRLTDCVTQQFLHTGDQAPEMHDNRRDRMPTSKRQKLRCGSSTALYRGATAA